MGESFCFSVVSTVDMDNSLIVGTIVTGISMANQEYLSSCLLCPMGSATSVHAPTASDVDLFQLHVTSCSPLSCLFSAIVDSGAMAHVMPFHPVFCEVSFNTRGVHYSCKQSQIPSISIGTIIILLHDFLVPLSEVLHVPSLRVPLILVQCFCCSRGCSFVTDNWGAFLSFHHFIVPVDDSADCLVTMSLINQPSQVHQVYFNKVDQFHQHRL